MTNIFEKTYAQVQEAKKSYDTATTDEAKAATFTLYHEVLDPIKALGAAACRIWREYEISRNSGNIYLDINDVVWDKDVDELIACMKENGIEHFTFSSTWSSAVETAWLFQKAGCRLEGLIEINSQHKDFMSDEHEKAHAYLFGLN